MNHSDKAIMIPSTLPEERALEFTDALVSRVMQKDSRIYVWQHQTHQKAGTFRTHMRATINGHVCTIKCTQTSLDEIQEIKLLINWEWCGSTHWTACKLSELETLFLLTGEGITSLPLYQEYQSMGEAYAQSLEDLHPAKVASRFLDVAHDLPDFGSGDYLHEIWIMPGLSQGINPNKSVQAFLESIVANRFNF